MSAAVKDRRIAVKTTGAPARPCVGLVFAIVGRRLPTGRFAPEDCSRMNGASCGVL